jgi:hypothetical protein
MLLTLKDVKLCDDPQRSPEWRWELISLLREGARTRGVYRDDLINLSVRLLRAYDRCENELDIARLRARDPDFFHAYQIQTSSSLQFKEELKSRILANESREAISEKCSVSLRTLELFEEIYFDVRSRLKSAGFIVHKVIGENIQYGLTERLITKLWCWVGYMYGAHALDWLIYHNSRGPQTLEISQLKEGVKEEIMSSMLRKQFIASKTIPVSLNTQIPLLDMFLRKQELDVEAENNNVGIMGVDENLASLFQLVKTVPLQIGSKVFTRHSEIVESIQNNIVGSVELNAEEAFYHATHGELPAHVPTDLCFPDKEALNDDET